MTAWGEPVDPWAGSVAGFEDEQTWAIPTVEPEPTLVIPQTPKTAERAMTRPLYGAIYCCQTAVDTDKYVGKSGRAPWVRVNEHRKRQLWGPEILAGRAGYRVLEWVEESGRGAEYDAANLAYREALWIQRINPTENGLRPIPVPPEQALARKAAARERAARTTAAVRTRPVARFRVAAFLFWVAVWTAAAAWLLHFAPDPRVPWIGGPALGVILGWATLWEIRRKFDQLTNPKARPPARRRPSRRRRRR